MMIQLPIEPLVQRSGLGFRSSMVSSKSLAINSNWSSVAPREGWKHFRIAGRRRDEDGLWLEMMAICDRQVRFWVPKDELGDALLWQTGLAKCKDGLKL